MYGVSTSSGDWKGALPSEFDNGGFDGWLTGQRRLISESCCKKMISRLSDLS